MNGMANDRDAKVAFITGASDEAVISSCERFWADGYSVGFTYGATPLPQLAERDRILAQHTPNMSAPELSKAVVDTAERFGGIDVLVFIHYAGETGGGEMFLDLGEDDWDGAIVSAKAFFLSCKYAIPYLINSRCARVILMSRENRGGANIAEYAAAQTLKALSERAGNELSDFGIGVVYSPVGERDNLL